MNQVGSNLMGPKQIAGDISIERKLANIPPQIVRPKCLFTAQNNSKHLRQSNLNIAAPEFVAPPNPVTPMTNNTGAVGTPRLAMSMGMAMNMGMGNFHSDGVWRPFEAQPCFHCHDERMVNMGPLMNCMPKTMFREPEPSNISLIDGIIIIRLKEDIIVELTMDKSIRVTNSRHNITVSISSNGNSAALIHPNGRVYQYNGRVEMVVHDGTNRSTYVRYAKMWQKGISFTRNNCPVIYLVDSAGTRTTTDTFLDLSKDYVSLVFTGDCHSDYMNYAHPGEIVQESRMWVTQEGSDMIEINGFKISQTTDGLVRVTRNKSNCLIRTSPTNGSVTLTTQGLHCTASMGPTPHLFVRHGERRMHFDGSVFVVRNAGHSAGFEENNLLKVY